MRVKFRKGMQRRFLKKILTNVNCPSLRAFLQFGFDVPYSTLKNYYCESRCLPNGLFEELCSFGKIDKADLKFSLIDDNWGRIDGGKKSRR
jgi:hypothetical protein